MLILKLSLQNQKKILINIDKKEFKSSKIKFNQFINLDLKLFFKEALKRKIIKKQYYKKNTISQIKILNEIDQVHQTDPKE